MAKRKKDKTTAVVDPPVLNVLDINEDFSKPVEVPTGTAEHEPPIDHGIPVGSFAAGEETKKRTYSKRKPKEPEDGIPIIDGEMLLLLIDILIPMLISTTHNAVTDTRISPDDLTLTEKQKTMMRTFADKVAERIRLNANPFLMLFAGLGGIYTMNYMAERNKTKEAKP